MAAALSVAAISPAQAQACPAQSADRQNVVKVLAERYGEAPTSMGLGSNGHVVEVFSSDSGSWTLIVTAPNGRSCMMASGQAWENLPVITVGTDS